MKTLKIIRQSQISVTECQEDLSNGIYGFQLVDVEINFFNSISVETFDTKVMLNGSRFIIDGNGFVKSGQQI